MIFYLKKKKFSEISEEFLAFIENKKLIIHNAEFDLSHLNNELSLIGKKPINVNKVIDTLKLAREKYPGASLNLDSLCKRFRIDNSRRKQHSALVDCELLSKVYINLIDQKEPKLNFQPIEEQKLNVFLKKDFIYNKKIVVPSKEEIENHSKFLKSELKKNFF